MLDIIEIGRGYIGGILLAMLMFTSLTSGMYAGESMTFETNLTNPYYTVIGNSSNLDGLNISFENGNITISTVLNFKPDNFTIILFDEKTKEVEKIVYRGGGGGGTRYIDRIEIQNETVYVPEYINNTEEVEKIVDNITVIQTGFELWHIILGMFLGVAFGLYVMRNWKQKPIEED